MINSSSLKQTQVHHTGTFKADIDSIDKYGNEVREFVIGHPNKMHFHSQSSKSNSDSYNKEPININTLEQKENMNNQNMFERPRQYNEYQKIAVSTRNQPAFAQLNYHNTGKQQTASEAITSRYGKS